MKIEIWSDVVCPFCYIGKRKFEKAVISNTLNAHRLLHFAKTIGLQHETKERLFASYYTMGRDLGDVETLVLVAHEIGLDPVAVRSMLESDEFINEVKMDQYHASQIGVKGVPFFVFNNKYAVSGAQPSSVFSEVLEKVWHEEQPLVNLGTSEGTCTVDGNCN